MPANMRSATPPDPRAKQRTKVTPARLLERPPDILCRGDGIAVAPVVRLKRCEEALISKLLPLPVGGGDRRARDILVVDDRAVLRERLVEPGLAVDVVADNAIPPLVRHLVRRDVARARVDLAVAVEQDQARI